MPATVAGVALDGIDYSVLDLSNDTYLIIRLSQGAYHHALVTGGQVIQKLFAFLPLKFHVVGNNGAEIVVGVLAALPVGNVGLHAQQTILHFPHRLIGGNGDHINGQHHVPVQIGQLRYQELNNISDPLLEIIKKNGVSVYGQLSIYNALERDIDTPRYALFSWAQMPTWDKLNYVLGLAENSIFVIDRHGISSVSQLAFYLNKYRVSKNIMEIVSMIYTKKLKSVGKQTAEKNSNKYYDEAVEQAFHIYRHWFQFTVPKAFRVVDSLQRYVCERHGKKAGSYSYFVQQLENDFIPENLSILSEFGIPTSAIRKMSSRIPNGLSEDETIEFIKTNKVALTRTLLQYEKDKLEYCL